VDNIETILQVGFLIIFFFGRFILRALLGGTKRVPKLSPPAKKAERPKVSRPAPVTEPAPSRRPRQSTMHERMPRFAARAAAPSLARMADAVLASLEVNEERSRALANTCHFRGFSELNENILLYDARIRELIVQMENAKDSKSLNRSAVDNYDKAVRAIDERLDVFDGVLKERGTSLGQQYNGADRILAEMIATSQKRHRGGQSLYQYLFPGVVHNPRILKGGLHGVIVSQDDIAQSERWSSLAFHMHLAVSERGHFATKIASDMGLPQATGSMSYFLSSGRLMAAGLIASWLDWIYADTAATLQLGEAYAWPFLSQCERDDQTAAFTLFDMDSRSRVSSMPLLARLITVHAVLQKMEGAAPDEFAARVAELMKRHPHLMLEIQGKTQVPIVASDVFGDLFQVAFSLVDTPLSVLDSYSPEAIWGTDFRAANQKKLAATAELLADGQPVFNTRPIRLLLAAHLARKQAHNAERRIETALLKSLNAQENVQSMVTAPTSVGTGLPQTLEDVFSPEMLPQTIMIGALARSRGGISGINR
jgi:hypothetical protein